MSSQTKPRCIVVALFLQGFRLVVLAMLVPRLNHASEAEKYVGDVGGSDFADNRKVSD